MTKSRAKIKYPKRRTMKTNPHQIAVGVAILLLPSAYGQELSFNPNLPSTDGQQVGPTSSVQSGRFPASLPSLSAYVGTYVGVVIYYDINNGVGDWEVIFDRDGTIRLSDKFQMKYPNARVSGTFKRDGTFTYTNQSTNGVTFTTTGRINRALQKFTATFTSNSAGTGVLLCNKL